MSQREDQTPDSVPAEPTLNWDRIMALLAVGLSITAILVSLFEVNSVRAHSKATVWPHVSAVADLSEAGLSIEIRNKGVGPALIQDAELSLDGQVVTDVTIAIEDALARDAEVKQTYQNVSAETQDAFRDYTLTDLTRSVIAAGETVEYFSMLYVELRPNEDDQNNALILKTLADDWDGKADLSLCYCSIQDDCWRTTLVSGESVSVPSCAVRAPRSDATPAVQVARGDFGSLMGDDWTGTLSYLDYTTNQPSEIPVEITVRSASDRTIVYQIRYPRESEYNEIQRIRISSDGTRIDGNPIISRTRGADGRLVLVTEGRSSDNSEPADVRYTYEIGARAFDISQQVRPDGTEAYFERNRFSLTR